MKANARTSLLNPGAIESVLRRFWPLCLAYFVVLGLLFVVPLYTAVPDIVRMSENAAEAASELSGLWGAELMGALAFAFVSAPIAAVALDEWLFDAAAATFAGSLPLRRRTLFFSTYVAGLGMLLVVPALGMLCVLPLCAIVGSPFVPALVARWYLTVAAATFVCYTVAQLVCLCSGTRAVAVLLYGVINFLPLCLEAAARLVLSVLVYGFAEGDYVGTWLSPVVGFVRYAFVFDGALDDMVKWGCVCVYCGVAVLALAGCSMLFARRDLECAGTPVAISVLRPLLSVLAGISMALLFATVFCVLGPGGEALDAATLNASASVLLCATMALGGFLGVLFARMIMDRSARVLARSWKICVTVASIVVVVVCGCRLDLLGVFSRVPDASEVTSASISCNFSRATTLHSETGISDTLALQQQVLAYGGRSDGIQNSETLQFAYELANGRTLVRTYPVYTNYFSVEMEDAPLARDDGAPLVKECLRIANTPEGRKSRYAALFEDAAYDFVVRVEIYGGGLYESAQTRLPASQTEAFLKKGVRPDILECMAGDARMDITYMLEQPIAAIVYMERLDGEELYSMQLDEQATPHMLSWLRKNYPGLDLAPEEING